MGARAGAEQRRRSRSTHKSRRKAVDAPVIKGIGDCMLYLVDRYGDKGTIYDPDYDADAGRRA